MTHVTYRAECPNGHQGAAWTDILESSGAPSHDIICADCDPPPLVRVPAQRTVAASGVSGLARFLGAMARS